MVTSVSVVPADDEVDPSDSDGLLGQDVGESQSFISSSSCPVSGLQQIHACNKGRHLQGSWTNWSAMFRLSHVS